MIYLGNSPVGVNDMSSGGGGLSVNNAVIHVNADAGSTITFSKGGVIVKTFGPEKQHINAEVNTRADWYLSVSSANYGEWTVTEMKDGKTSSKTVTVDSAKQYDLTLKYNVEFVKNGIIQSGFSTSQSGGVTVTQQYGGNCLRVYHAKPGSNTNYYLYFTPAHDFSAVPYSTLHVDYEIADTSWDSSNKTTKIGFGAGSLADAFNASASTSSSATSVSRTTITADIHNLGISLYLKIKMVASSSHASDMRYYNIWID